MAKTSDKSMRPSLGTYGSLGPEPVFTSTTASQDQATQSTFKAYHDDQEDSIQKKIVAIRDEEEPEESVEEEYPPGAGAFWRLTTFKFTDFIEGPRIDELDLLTAQNFADFAQANSELTHEAVLCLMECIRRGKRHSELLRDANKTNRTKFEKVSAELTRVSSERETLQASYDEFKMEMENHANNLDLEVESKESESQALHATIKRLQAEVTRLKNQQPKSQAQGQEPPPPSPSLSPEPLTDFQRYLAGRQRRTGTPQTVDGEPGGARIEAENRALRFPDPPVFTGEDPSEYKGWKTLMQAKIRGSLSQAADIQKLDYIQSRTKPGSTAFELILNRYGNADCADEDIFITDSDLWRSFDEAFLDVNEEVKFNDQYSSLKQSTGESFKLFHLKFEKLAQKLHKPEGSKRLDLPHKLNDYYFRNLSNRGRQGKSYAQLVLDCKYIEQDYDLMKSRKSSTAVEKRDPNDNAPKSNASGPKSNTHNNRDSSNDTRRVIPMKYHRDNLPPLTEELRKRLSAENRCWRCREKGHMGTDTTCVFHRSKGPYRFLKTEQLNVLKADDCTLPRDHDGQLALPAPEGKGAAGH